MTWPEATSLAEELARMATAGGPEASAAGAGRLADLDGRSWLLLDEAGRSVTYVVGKPVGWTRKWRNAPISEASGFVAAVASFHRDGHVRQRATGVLAGLSGVVPATALAVRSLDHVRQVREAGQAGLLGSVDETNAPAVLSVLLAGRERQHGQTVLALVIETLLERRPVSELVRTLLREGRRDVRRWAFDLGHERDVFTSDDLLVVVQSDPDQWMRAGAAERLLPIADTQQLEALIAARTAEARIVAVTRLEDEFLTDDALTALLVDRASRVREQARWRARRRGIDIATWYRHLIGEAETSDRVKASAIEGLAAVGGQQDRTVFTDHLAHKSVRVRAAAITGVSIQVGRGDALVALQPLLLDVSPRVSTSAALALIRLQAPRESAEQAWASAQPWSRRAAWRISRSTGSWDRIEADLRAATDTDPRLAVLGLAGVHAWLQAGAASTWAVLADSQRERIREQLLTGVVDDAARRTVAFHTGIRLPQPLVAPDAVDQNIEAPDRRSWWWRAPHR